MRIRNSGWLTAISVVLLASSARLVRHLMPSAAAGTAPKSAPPTAPSVDQVETTWAGSGGCRQCHERFYALWAPSHHGLAMQPYSADFARERLTPQQASVVVGDRQYRAEIGPEAGWVVERRAGQDQRLPIAHVLGGKNVFYFLTPGDRGRLQTLPVAYDLRRAEWFDTAASGVRHFAGQPDAEPLYWTDQEYTFNTSCYSCHVSQLSTNYDLQTDAYHTSWAEPGINCETCHGPGAEHVRVCRAAAQGEVPEDLKIISTRQFTVGQTNAMCAPCHAKMVSLSTDFRPGARYFDHYDLVTLEHDDFYPDGRDLGENYTYTSWLMSPCVKPGQLDCMHCHTSSGRFRFADRPNDACLPCHQQRVENATAHSRHPAGSEGNVCIACHMPRTEFARMVRSDHSMQPPTPATTLAFESPNACNLCHRDKGASWADRWVREWRTRDYQAAVLHRAGLIDAARKRDWRRLPEMLAYLASETRDAVFVTGLIRLMRSCEDGRKWPALLQTLKDPSPLVRGAAAEALDGWLTPESVEALLGAAGDDFRLVRVRAAASLAPLPREYAKGQNARKLARATAEFKAVMHSRPDDSASHYNLGNFHLQRREHEEAIACFETAHRLDPRGIAPLVNVSIAYNLAGQNDKAEARLRRAIEIEPTSVAGHVNLGMLLAELGRLPEAEETFRAAWKVDPQSAISAYNLAVILAEDRLPEALVWCRRANQLRPDEPKYAYTLAFYLRTSGDTSAAISTLQAALADKPAHADCYKFLGNMWEERGKPEQAAAVYLQAAGNDRLPKNIRRMFETQAKSLSRSSE